jgi:hypothetical protein
MKEIVFVQLDRLLGLIESHLVVNLQETFELFGLQKGLESVIHLRRRDLELEKVLLLLERESARDYR